MSLAGSPRPVKLSQRIRPNCEAAPWVIDAVLQLEQRIEQLEAALQKIRTEPGDARDCRYIAGQALAATEQEKGE